MMLDAPAAPGVPIEDDAGAPESAPEALIEEARRARRHRYFRYGAGLLVLAVLTAAGLLVDHDRGGAGRGSGVDVATPAHAPRPLAETAPPGVGVVGAGPTAVDFSGPAYGWIASGGVGAQISDPTIVRTTNSGQTWQRTPVPNLAGQDIPYATALHFRGSRGHPFCQCAERGWFFQAGLGWQTNDSGATWKLMKFHLTGDLVAMTSSGRDVWALVDTCSPGVISCPQSMGRAVLFHAEEAPTLVWKRAGPPFAAGTYGGGSLFPTRGHGVVVAFGPETFHRSVIVSAQVASLGCESVGTLSGGKLAGICDTGGGGDASVSRVELSADNGQTWHALLGGTTLDCIRRIAHHEWL